jgi:hypothetical protein
MNDIHTLIDNLIKYSDKPEWAPLFDQVWDQHIEHVADILHLPFEELANLIEETDLYNLIFDAIFDDFATRDLEDDPPSFALSYLKRRGWRETPRARQYLEALAHSHPSLYEIIEVKPGEGVRLKDLLNPGETFWVNEKASNHRLQPKEILFARVLQLNGETSPVLASVIHFPHDAGETLLEIYRATDWHEHFSPEEMAIVLTSMAITHIISTVFTRLTQTFGLTNHDGDPLASCQAHIPLCTHPAAVEEKLDASKIWHRTAADERQWELLRKKPRHPKDRMLVDALVDKNHILIASLYLEDRHLSLEANSEKRVHEALEALKQTLPEDFLGQAKITCQPLTELLAQGAPDGPHAALALGDMTTPDPEAQALVKDWLDSHYRETLRERIPFLGDKTPRQALRSKKGRQLVIEWLQRIEKSAKAQGYDASWMWDELGLGEEREQILR